MATAAWVFGKRVKYLLVAVSLLALQANVAAQVGNSDAVTAKAEVISPITIASTTVMDFGKLYTFADAYTVTLLPDGYNDQRTSTNANVPTLSDGSIKLAGLEVEGFANSAFSIQVPTTSVDLTHDDGTTTMGLTAVKAYTDNGTEITSNVSLNGSGKYDFRVGATLTLGAGQKVGLYEGSFDVTVTYE